MSQAANIVYEQSNGTGTGNITLVDLLYFRTFASVFSTGATNLFWYSIRNRSAGEWEVGIGYMQDATTMVRVSVKESSNANNLVNFTAGLKDVICDVPAHLQIRRTALTGTGLTATGTNQATALAIPGDVAMHDFSTVAGSTGARLDPVTDKSNVFIVNRGANQLRVYPATGQTINANGTNSPYLVNPSSVVQLIGRTASNWQTLPSYNGGTVNSQSSSNGLFLNGTGISPGTYGNSYFIPQIVVGSDGRLTFAQDLLPYISYTQVYDITTAFALYSTGGLSRGEVVALASAEFN